MGEYPKRSEIKSAERDNPYNGSTVEIKQDSRYQQLTRRTMGEEADWYDEEDHYPFRIENGCNFGIGYVTEILTSSETHPHGIMVQIDNCDVGRVQRILVGEELELHTAKSLQKYNNDTKKTLALTEEQKELLQKHGLVAEFFPKSEIPPHEDDKNEFKASFKTPMKPLANSDDEEDAVVENVPENTGNSLKRSVINAVTAFANSGGGRLFIGIDDKTGKVIGSKSGSEMMNLKTNEKYDHYKRAIQDTIFEFTKRRPDNIEFQKGEDEEFLVLYVKKGTEPTYVNDKNKEMYYIRLDGESVPCYGGDMIRHMKKRFPNEIGSNKNDTPSRWNQDRRNYRR